MPSIKGLGETQSSSKYLNFYILVLSPFQMQNLVTIRIKARGESKMTCNYVISVFRIYYVPN